MKKIHKVLLGIAFFLIFFVYFVFETAPAAKVIKMIDLPKEISLVGVTGTVFDGAASNLTIDKYSYENIRWHTSLWGLITKQLTLIVKDPQGLNGIGSVQFNKDGSYDFEDVKMKISFANFLKYAKYSLPVKVNGNIDLSIDEASMSMNKCRKLKSSFPWMETWNMICLAEHMWSEHSPNLRKIIGMKFQCCCRCSVK